MKTGKTIDALTDTAESIRKRDSALFPETAKDPNALCDLL